MKVLRNPNKILRSLAVSSMSIVPILLIVTLLSLTGLTPLPDPTNYALLWVGGVVLIIGLATFSNGAERSLSKVGEHMGASLSKQKHLWVVVIIAILLGALITCAEPSISILASETPIPKWIFVLFVSLGVGVFTAVGIVRVIKHRNLNLWLLALYGLMFALCLLVEQTDAFPLIFDAGGATTGSATVPFLLSLGASVAMVRGGKKSQDDSFGLIGIASIGPLLSLVIMFIFARSGLGTYEIVDPGLNDQIFWVRFSSCLLPTFNSDGGMASYGILIEVAMSVSPILLIFLIYQFIFIRLPKAELFRILIGFVYTYCGLVLFLMGTTAAMMPIGQQIGLLLGNLPYYAIIIIAFVIGMVTILCEPAIHVLTKQIEKVSDGSISNKSVLASLSVGVGIAIALCAIRAIYNFSIMYYMVPGYIIALLMTFICPKLFTAMAFDSGGVASGPMTTSFVLPMVIGLTLTLNGGDSSGVMSRAFGVIGMVAMIPMIAIQGLGIYTKFKNVIHVRIFKKSFFSENDAEIIHF